MLKISKLADYGTVIVHNLSKNPNAMRSASVIAQDVCLSVSTVSKLLKVLAEAKLVKSTRGPNGGYQLNHAPESISMLDVLQAIDGPMGITECCQRDGQCTQAVNCEVSANWQHINRVMLDALKKVTFADLKGSLDCHPMVSKGIQFYPTEQQMDT